MKILYTQAIWVPTEELFQKNMDSCISLVEYLKEYPGNDIEFLFCGWTHKNEYFDQITSFIHENFKGYNFNIVPYARNFGKAYIVNHSVFDKEFDYLFIQDSDMQLDINCKDMFGQLLNCVEEVNRHTKKPFGFVAPMQKVFNCHIDCIYENIFHTSFGRFMYPNHYGGIAGGSLFISKECWNINKGYRQMGVCYGEDAWFLIDTFTNGMSYQVAESIWVNHPLETNKVYHAWKVNQCQNKQLPFEESMNKTEDYWKNLS